MIKVVIIHLVSRSEEKTEVFKKLFFQTQTMLCTEDDNRVFD